MSADTSTEQKSLFQRLTDNVLFKLSFNLAALFSFALGAFLVVNFVMHFALHKHLFFENWYVVSKYAGTVVSTAVPLAAGVVSKGGNVPPVTLSSNGDSVTIAM